MNRDFLINLVESEIKFNREPEVNLMRAVVKQAFLDILIISGKNKYKKRKKDAGEWFEEESIDFHMVCSLAHLEVRRIKMLYSLVSSCNYMPKINSAIIFFKENEP